MIISLFYKEWIKTRWFLLLALIVVVGLANFMMTNFQQLIASRGLAHVWLMMLTHKATFITQLKFVPTAIGLLLAIIQFVPEVQRKCFKLTLHLPLKIETSLAIMLLWGSLLLTLCFSLNFLVLWFNLHAHLTLELMKQSFTTLIPWYLAGYLIYFLVATVVLEPTWKWRLSYFIVLLLELHLFFLRDTPYAYIHFVSVLVIFLLLSLCLVWHSLYRFKLGYQD